MKDFIYTESARNLFTYDCLDLILPPLPIRSCLYQLQPLHVGKPMVESLTSYIIRLSNVHSVSTGSLISKIVTECLDKEYISYGSSKGLHKLYSRTSALNGIGVMAVDWVQAIQTLTLRNELSRLTLLNWRSVFPSRKLLRQKRAWCSYCYQEWLLSGEIICEPLLWAVDSVKLCHKHGTVLVMECSHCERELPWLDWWSKPGYCSKCKQWLGLDLRDKSKKIFRADELKWQSWATDNIGGLLSFNRQNLLSKETVAKTISACIQQTTKGNVAEFARMLNLPKNTVWLWQSGRNLPTLDKLMKICYLVQKPLVSFLTEEFSAEEFPKVSGLSSRVSSKAVRPPSRLFNSSKIAGALEAELLCHGYPPSKTKEVANRLEYDVRLLREHFPEQCRSISRKYACY